MQYKQEKATRSILNSLKKGETKKAVDTLLTTNGWYSVFHAVADTLATDSYDRLHAWQTAVNAKLNERNNRPVKE